MCESMPKKKFEPVLNRKSKEALLQKRGPGRQRIYDPVMIAEELLEWVQDEDSINFSGFCADRGYLPNLIWRIEKECAEFSEAYTLAKMKLAERRERFLNADMLNYGAFQRYQSGYDPFLTKAEDEEKDKDAHRKKGLVETEQANLFLLAKLAAEGKISQKD